MKRLTLILAILLCASAAFAQGYNGLSYPGNSAGNPSGANGRYYGFQNLPVDLVYTGNYSTAGTAMTASIGNNSMSSSNCAPGTCATWGTPGGSSQYFVGANQSVCDNLGPFTLNTAKTFYGPGLLNYNSIEYVNSTPVTYWALSIGVSASVSNITVGGCVTPVPAVATGGIDLFEFASTTGGTVWGQVYEGTDGNYGFHIETGVLTGGESTNPTIEPGNSLFPGPFLVAMNMNDSQNGLGVYGTYSSGGSVTGSAGQLCNAAFSGGQSGYVPLTGANSLTGAAVYGIATAGTPWVSAPTTATLSAWTGSGGTGAASCSGTITLSGATLGGVGTISVHNAYTGALVGSLQVPIGYASSPGGYSLYFGNGESFSGAATYYLQNLFAIWTGTVPTDPFASW